VEFGSIEREVFIEASPEVVFEVITQPEHIAQWWSDEAHYEPVAGSTGEVVFYDHGRGGRTESLTVVEAAPLQRFSFRWTNPATEAADESNSLLVTFELTPSGDGTLLKITETGFREQGWEAAALEWHYRDHIRGWDMFLPNLAPYVASLRSTR
jgi:uncharacterized protein YndB with AHSA1/START domain